MTFRRDKEGPDGTNHTAFWQISDISSATTGSLTSPAFHYTSWTTVSMDCYEIGNHSAVTLQVMQLL